MVNVTDYFLSKTKRIVPEVEVSDPTGKFKMFNSGGVEVEIAELLYALVRSWKPKQILETGTHYGISSAYMAQGLQDNDDGHLTTCEINPAFLSASRGLWSELGLSSRVTGMLKPSLQFTPDPKTTYGMIFLDSEPAYRFDEFNRFWDFLEPNGLILIHDLNWNLGHHGDTHHGQFDWPYGYWKPKLGHYVTNFDVQLLHVPNPRGLTIFQKTRPDIEENIKLLKEPK